MSDWGFHGCQIFRHRAHKHIPVFNVLSVATIARNALRGFPYHAGNTQSPAQAEIAVLVPGAVDEIELWLKTTVPGREGDGKGEVAGSRVKIRRKLLAETLLGTSALRESDDLTG